MIQLVLLLYLMQQKLFRQLHTRFHSRRIFSTYQSNERLVQNESHCMLLNVFAFTWKAMLVGKELRIALRVYSTVGDALIRQFL